MSKNRVSPTIQFTASIQEAQIILRALSMVDPSGLFVGQFSMSLKKKITDALTIGKK